MNIHAMGNALHPALGDLLDAVRDDNTEHVGLDVFLSQSDANPNVYGVEMRCPRITLTAAVTPKPFGLQLQSMSSYRSGKNTVVSITYEVLTMQTL